MKSSKVIFCVLVTLLAFSCAKTEEDSLSMMILQEAALSADGTLAVREIIESDQAIDLSVADVMALQAAIQNEQPADSAVLIKLKASLHRFYSNVAVEGNALVVTERSGDDIGLSNDLFAFYKQDLARLNEELEMLNKQANGTSSGQSLHDNLQGYLRQLKGE